MDTVVSTRWVEPTDYESLAARLQQKNALALASLAASRGVQPRAIDLGCGTGFLAEQILLQQVSREVTCVDLSQEMLATAKAKATLRDQTFVCASILDLDLPATFDLVCSNAALHWLYPRYRETFQAARRLTRDGGLFAFAMAGECAASRLFDDRIEAAFSSVGRPQDPIPFRERRITVAAAERLCVAAGFVVEDAFLIDRSVEMDARDYAHWLIASGGPWGAAVQQQGEIVADLVAALAPAGETVETGHWSTLVIARAVP
ncbi:class I SAM-dependent methyltransferase [Phenylobacterium sp.]|uniref:class I SAM-dependent methyltransferase n=1 Tax=Phenylobacterium sp. TaxID=1871053 RepID=UPI003BA98E6E